MINESLKKHVALVTGASSGIGRAIALQLAEAGADVVCADLQSSAIKTGFEADIETDTVELIKQSGGNACFVKTDVLDPNAVQAAVKIAVDQFGRLDVMVNCAGVWGQQDTICEMSEKDYDFQMGVNAKGVWLCCKYGIEQMMNQEPLTENIRGRIINVSSLAGIKGMINSSAYSQSKASVIGVTRSLAVEWAKSGITVNGIAPGLIQTAMAREGFDDPETRERIISATPVGRHGMPADIARAVLFLAADEAGFITGHTLPVDGGMAAL